MKEKNKKYKKNCPSCGCEQIYKNKYNFKRSLDENKKCIRCCQIGKSCGENNGFFGKKHSKETKLKISNSLKGYTVWNKGKKTHQCGENNAMTGKSVLYFLIKKHGMENANKIWDDIQRRKSLSSRGKNNPMYGKPTPQGSGSGWKGWYKGWFFRSLRELSYMLNIIERYNIKWESAEKGKFKIKYKDDNLNDRTYSADFVLNGKYLIEIKPKKLMNSPQNKAKRDAAIKWCEKHDMIYKMSDCHINKYQILNEYKNGNIKWQNVKYEKMILEYHK